MLPNGFSLLDQNFKNSAYVFISANINKLCPYPLGKVRGKHLQYILIPEEFQFSISLSHCVHPLVQITNIPIFLLDKIS